MLTVSILRQTEIIIRRRHFLNGAVGQGRRHHRLQETTKEDTDFEIVTFAESRSNRARKRECATCASCCTLACSLAGDCFISSASLSLNFLNILVRKRRSVGDDKRAISARAKSESLRDERRSRAVYSGALFTWTRTVRNTGNPNYNGTVRHGRHSDTGNASPPALLGFSLARTFPIRIPRKSRMNVELHYLIIPRMPTVSHTACMCVCVHWCARRSPLPRERPMTSSSVRHRFQRLTRYRVM